MATALEHPLVAEYLRSLSRALTSLDPDAAAELSEQLRAHIVEALPPGAPDDMVAEVLAALGPPSAVAAEVPRQPLWHRAAFRVRRLPLRTWLKIVPAILGCCVAAGTLIFWGAQPSLIFDSGYTWWYPVDSAHDVTTQAAGVTQDTVPIRPGQLQGFAVLIYNPSGVTQRILGSPDDMVSLGAPVPPQIWVAATTPMRFEGAARAVRYQRGGVIPPHSYRWVRVLWRSYRCYLSVGAGQGSDTLTVRVRLGWVTRTEEIQLPTEFAVTQTKANAQAAYCKAHGYNPAP